MKPSDMLHKMCHEVLAGTDLKALCKARGLSPQAASSRGILETLFLSTQGLSDVFDSLDAKEIASLHLLKNAKVPVDVSFFGRIYGGNHSYGCTFNQRYQNCFAKVKKRLVRTGILLLAEAPQAVWEKKSKMERWRFALPVEFHGHLPPLIPSSRQFDGEGNWRPNVVRDKLSKDLGRSNKGAAAPVFQIEAGELQLNGKRFEAAKLIGWQQAGWRREIQEGKAGSKDSHSQPPDEAALCILSELDEGFWADADQLAEPLQVFCGKRVEGDAVCQAGWEWGLLAKRQADDKTWFRPAPQQPYVAPHHYLTPNDQDGCVTADLTAIPFDALEQLVAISDQRAGPGRSNSLLLAPNFVKLGRAGDELLAAEPVAWLVEHTQPFAEAYVKLGELRGKTILHENLYVARVNDLSLKVALEKALGNNLVSLKNEFVAFPRGLLDDVRRVVKKSGHVVKEVSAK